MHCVCLQSNWHAAGGAPPVTISSLPKTVLQSAQIPAQKQCVHSVTRVVIQ